MKLQETLEAFLASEDFFTGVRSSTKASWSGGNYCVELFLDGSWRMEWSNSIGNLYESQGSMLNLPILDIEDMADFLDHGGSEDDFFAAQFEVEEEDLKSTLRGQFRDERK